MDTNFRLIFWGLILIALTVAIHGFDLLPDGVGYMLIAIGCGRLSVVSPSFSIARAAAWTLAGLWLVSFAVDKGDATVMLSMAMLVISWVMMWTLLGGITEIALEHNRGDLAERAAHRRTLYVVLGVATVFLVLAGGRHPGDLAHFGAGLAIVMIILLAMILHLIHRVRTELDWDDPGPRWDEMPEV